MLALEFGVLTRPRSERRMDHRLGLIAPAPAEAAARLRFGEVHADEHRQVIRAAGVLRYLVSERGFLEMRRVDSCSVMGVACFSVSRLGISRPEEGRSARNSADCPSIGLRVVTV